MTQGERRDPVHELICSVCSKAPQKLWKPLENDVRYLVESLGYGVTAIKLRRRKRDGAMRVVAVDRRGNALNERDWHIPAK